MTTGDLALIADVVKRVDESIQADKMLGQSKQAVLKRFSGKLPVRVVIGNKFVVLTEDSRGQHVHTNHIEGIYNVP